MAVNLDAYTITHSITNVQISKDLETSDPTMFACVRVPNREMHVDDVRLDREIRVFMDPSDGSKLDETDSTEVPLESNATTIDCLPTETPSEDTGAGGSASDASTDESPGETPTEESGDTSETT